MLFGGFGGSIIGIGFQFGVGGFGGGFVFGIITVSIGFGISNVGLGSGGFGGGFFGLILSGGIGISGFG